MKIDGDLHKTFEGDVKYPYADIGGPHLVHISHINVANRKDYEYNCPYCKKVLIPRLGNKRDHCFAHKPNQSCDKDKYIHETAKRLLKEKWDSDAPFEITMKVRKECKEMEKCPFKKSSECFLEVIETFDLKKYYSECLVEKKIDTFIPDLCLKDESGKHSPIFIEIWSTHSNSEEKRNSNYKIIEIRIKDFNKLKELTEIPIIESETVTFSHFPTVKKNPEFFCGANLMKYTLYKSLKTYVEVNTITCSNFRKRQPSAIFEIVAEKGNFDSTKEFYKYCNAVANDRGYNTRTCFICKQYAFPKDDPNGEKEWDSLESKNEKTEKAEKAGCKRNISIEGIISCNPREEAKNCFFFDLNKIALDKKRFRYSAVEKYCWMKEYR